MTAEAVPDWRNWRDAPQPGQTLCALDTIPDRSAREFVFGVGLQPFRMLVCRRGHQAFGYLNRCPHASMPLNHRPDEFMARDGDHLMCRRHFALFRAVDGVCVAGACEGAALTPVPVAIDANGVVRIT